MKIYIHYDITNQPWGGINSFFKAFKEHVKLYSNVKVVDRITDDCDILLMGANAYGREERIKYSDIERVKGRGVKVIHRLDGLRSKYTKNTEFSRGDLKQIKLAELADYLIFQSKSCYDVFKDMGLLNNKCTIIPNGVNQEIFNSKGLCRDYRTELKFKILSVSWSSNINKGFETIAKMSEMPGVQSFFVGNWCKDVDSKQVTILKPVRRKYLAQYYRTCDLFLHAAEDDPCPNVVLEALSSGMPIVYHNSGGTPDIVRGCGVPLKESLEKTLAIAFDRYAELLVKVQNGMKYFSIDYSAFRYVEVFKQILKV